MAKLRLGFIIIVLLLVFSLLTASKGEIDMNEYLSLPSPDHPFGCDSLGRDEMGRTSYAFLVSFSLSLVSSLIGTLSALLLVFFIRNVPYLGPLLYSFLKAVKTVPSMVLGLFLLSFPGNGKLKLVFTLSLSASSSIAILLVPLLSSIEGEEYIIAERSLGLREGRIYSRHIVPALLPVIREEFSLSLISSIITESSLSFLSLGMDESVPTLGRLLSEARSTVLTYPHTMIFPASVLFMLGLGVLFIERGLSELDSSSQGTRQGCLVDIAQISSDRDA